MLPLQVFRAAFLSGGGISVALALSLKYEGGHKTLTLIIWFALGVLLLAGGVTFWIEIHRRKGDEPITTTGIAASDEARVITRRGSIAGFDKGLDARDQSQIETEDTDVEYD